jgi:hypothetical protein
MKRARTAGVAVAAALAVLAGAEALLRSRRGAPPESERLLLSEARYLYAESRLPFFRRDGALWVTNRPRALAQSFPDAKHANELRVFVVGESVALRLGPGPVRQAFLEMFPFKAARAVDAGMGTYSSAQWSGVLDEVLARSPDVVVVMAGNNEGLRADGPWWPAYRLNLALRRSWLWRLTQDALLARLAGAPDRVRVEERFESRLRAAVRAARARGCAVVLCTLPVNAAGLPPLGGLPRGDADFDAGWSAVERGRAREAADAFARFAARRPESAMGRYWLARALADAGEKDRARAEFAAALERDVPDRCPPSRNAAIRRIAREEGAALADLEELFARRAPGGVPGWESFGDAVHPRESMNLLTARALAAAAAAGPSSATDPRPVADRLRELPPPPPWRPGPELDAATWSALTDALQARLRSPDVLLERAVAGLGLMARIEPARLRALAADPAPYARALAESDWTRPLAPLVPGGLAGLRAHADEALRRARSASRLLSR